MYSDKQLWQNLREGKKEALASIYQNEVDALFRYGCQFTANQTIVEDSIQDLFIELWNRRANLGTTDSIRKYLLVALRRKVVRELQRDVKREDRHLKRLDAEAHTSAVEAKIIEKEEMEQRQQNVDHALTLLSPRQREILYLRYFEDMDYQDIANRLEINYQSVRNTASAGMKALRKLLTLLILFFCF